MVDERSQQSLPLQLDSPEPIRPQRGTVPTFSCRPNDQNVITTISKCARVNAFGYSRWHRASAGIAIGNGFQLWRKEDAAELVY